MEPLLYQIIQDRPGWHLQDHPQVQSCGALRSKHVTNLNTRDMHVPHTQPDVTQDTGTRKDPKSYAGRTVHLGRLPIKKGEGRQEGIEGLGVKNTNVIVRYLKCVPVSHLIPVGEMCSLLGLLGTNKAALLSALSSRCLRPHPYPRTCSFEGHGPRVHSRRWHLKGSFGQTVLLSFQTVSSGHKIPSPTPFFEITREEKLTDRNYRSLEPYVP